MGIESRADADLLGLVNDACGDLGQDILPDIETGTCTANLTMIEKNGVGSTG
jgi:hypothetical protein